MPDLNRCHQARNELSAPRSLTFSYLRVTVVSVEHIAAELLVVMPEQMVKRRRAALELAVELLAVCVVELVDY